MTAFAQNFLFLRDPRGGVENIVDMAAAEFEGVYCNIGDSPRSAWATVEQRARAQWGFCGWWSRCDPGEPPTWNPARLTDLIAEADKKADPFIVNAEKGLDLAARQAPSRPDPTITREIAQKVGDRDAAISMEQMPFGDVDWTPVSHLPMLPQKFPAETGMGETSEQIREAWWNAGIKCVYMTFGTYAGAHGRPTPGWYDLKAPYSLYTADDVQGGPANYDLWSPTSSGWKACNEEVLPMPPPADPVPAGAYDDVAKLQTDNIKRPDGKDATAFNSQATSLKASRTAVNDHEKRIAAIEKKLGL